MPRLFNVDGFGPPFRVTGTSSWPWVDHRLSGLMNDTRRAIHTRFRFGSVPEGLNLAASTNSRAHYAKGTWSPVDLPKQAHRAPTACKYTVSGSFHSPSGVLFTFHSRYLYAIGRQVVLSLRPWSAQIHAGFHVTGATWESY